MNKKVFSQHNSAPLTDEERQTIRNFDETREKERQELLSKLGVKEDKDFMEVNFEPFEDRILVFPDPTESVTAGGIIVPDSVNKKARPLTGTVVKVGPGKDKPLPLNSGDRIAYGNYAGTEFEINGVKYLIMRFADCFGSV